MDPRKWLERLCHRHGLSADQHADLLPLAEKAASGPPEARQGLLALIAEALALRAARGLAGGGGRATLDESLLLEVARALHGWLPAPGLPGSEGPDAEPEAEGA